MKRMMVVTRGLESGTASALPSLTMVHLHNVQMLAEGGIIDCRETLHLTPQPPPMVEGTLSNI